MHCSSYCGLRTRQQWCCESLSATKHRGPRNLARTLGVLLVTGRVYGATAATTEFFAADPPVVLVRNFASRAEVDALLESATWHASDTDSANGVRRTLSRTSSSSAPDPRKWPAVGQFQRRIFELLQEVVRNTWSFTAGKAPTNFSVGAAEDLQLARYRAGEYFSLHPDTHPEVGMPRRVATVIVYLSDGFTGGETVFPDLIGGGGVGVAAAYRRSMVRAPDRSTCAAVHAGCPPHALDRLRALEAAAPNSAQGLWFCCCKEVLRVVPQFGSALIFFPNEDINALWHAGCPVGPGREEKLVAQQWFLDRMPSADDARI
eukprot:gnl/TRDRNA2_/TRDRNA2_58800_c0_seq1.p1 gnl/TRDRNA2_/TRDRNA2_58800_c0~~gnl/TRDRNA2_/TRDRNA2_58800_c0_seq1.p1  ORF type:complete len:318 (+),score=43.79 gnl/TRDRNA2_/TRDRNA2_58800_c0_seq1:17-970(+)